MTLWMPCGTWRGSGKSGIWERLDPLATGVLVLLLGKATRLVRFYAGRRKRYEAGFRFGYATNTYDSEGVAQSPDGAPALHREVLERLAAESLGRFEQMPPIFSAKKVHGRPAYELARKNQFVELKPASVELFEYRLDRNRRQHRALLD